MNFFMRSLLLSFLILSSSLFAQEGSVALRVGKLLHADGSVLDDATVVVQNGRITAVGTGDDVELPFDVLLREFPDAWLFPGFLEAHTSSGMDRANENVPVAPFLNVKDSIDPVAFYFEDQLREGVVGIGILPGNNCIFGGRGRVVAPHGMTMEAMTLREDVGVKIAFGPKSRWSRAAQLAEMREAIEGLGRTLRKKGVDLVNQEARDADLEGLKDDEPEKTDDGDSRDRAGGVVRYGPDFSGKDLISEEDLSDTELGLVRILNGDERLWLWCPGPTDVVHALSWLEEHELRDRAVFVVEAAAWTVADELAQASRPVVLSGNLWHVERDPATWEEVRTFAPKAFREAGVSVAIGSIENRYGPDRLAYQAATCIREGMSRADALASVTTEPARAWGLDGRLGRLAEGRDGTFVLTSDDPLALTSRTLGVWLRGVRIYDVTQDERLQLLLEGENR